MRRKPPKLSLLERLRIKKILRKPPKLSVCWYTEEEWVKIKAEAVDPERFEATYQDWLKMANEAFDDLQKAGLSPLKVLMIADELRQWCHINGRKNDSSSRALFAAELVGENRAIIVQSTE